MTRLCECGMCGLPVREGRRFVRGHNRKMQPRYTLDRATGCWLWDGRLLESGYGQYKDGGQVWQAHVWFWVQRHGPVPLGRELDHTCRNRRCVNPDHLEPVTHVENVRRGRACKLTIEDVAEIKARYLEWGWRGGRGRRFGPPATAPSTLRT
jgi:hypothetical protein